MMASFQHTNITKIIDFEETDTFLAIIMEYLEGQDLSELIDSGAKLSENEITSIFEQTLSAFQYAHEKGVIHRDIKPSNIYLLPNGKVKILDFGIAKLFGQGNEKTQAGTQMGTPIYMSPEQVKADKSIDHRSDIYSLGVTLYFALNGKPPYDADGASQFDIFNKIVYEPFPELSGDSKLIAMVKKACQKDRDQRYQSCEEWLEDLKQGVAPKVESLVGEKTVLSASSSDKTVVETPKGEKTVVVSVSEEKTTFATFSQQSNTVEGARIIHIEKSKKNKKVLIFTFSVIMIIGILSLFYYFYTKQNPKEVSIGKQTWKTENLNVDKFRNGDLIPEAKTNADWIKAGENKQPAWCYYDNNPENGTKYGKLYNWYTIKDPRGLAPVGWHIPTDKEWTTFSDILGGWNEVVLSNSSGFLGLPGGYRHITGIFIGVVESGYWWSASEINDTVAIIRIMQADGLISGGDFKGDGMSVRCVKD
jgi:uncharacterized protein (TIGR02145 family)